MTPVRLFTRCLWSSLGLVALWAPLASAQSALPLPVMADDVDYAPLESTIPYDSHSTGQMYAGEVLQPIPSIFDESACADCDRQRLQWDGLPAVTESTGTWLQRGFWYAEVDATVMNRYWNRSGVILASDNGFNQGNVFIDNRALVLRGAHPGYDGGVRFTLGHFLFRDADNRDHTAEFTAASSGDFTADNTITSSLGDALIVPFQIAGNSTGTPFDNADGMRVVYTSRYNNFEANYRVKRRMRKDQMVLEPTGEWVRRASPTWTREFLAGLRYFDLTERFDWTAQDIGANDDNGQYLIRTDNNLIGMQIGGGHAYQTGRWSLSALGKAGVYLNDAKGRQRLIMDDAIDENFITKQSEEQLSFIGEFRITSRVHLTPAFSIRAGYELMYVTSTALAAHQVHFIPVFTTLGTSGDPFYHGASFGFEGYW